MDKDTHLIFFFSNFENKKTITKHFDKKLLSKQFLAVNY